MMVKGSWAIMVSLRYPSSQSLSMARDLLAIYQFLQAAFEMYVADFRQPRKVGTKRSCAFTSQA
eukprot:1594485-Karenia_brevis.AAC.1